MVTASAARAVAFADDETVWSVPGLAAARWSWDDVRSQLRAGRWQRIGRAIVRHNGELTERERRRAALLNCGPRSALTAFTGLQEWGLAGWERQKVHVIVPRGARMTAVDELGIRPHYTDSWRPESINLLRRLHRPGPASVLAAATLARPRVACGVLAAAVQHRLVRPEDVIDEVRRSPRVRHRALLLAAASDIEQGAQAFSEIDFARLCRRAGLPEPTRQAVRTDRGGRRRYLDAEWTLPSGRRLVVEVDGALHLAAPRWWEDQLRQNELALSGDTVLRFPSVILRCETPLVVAQLVRALT